jgi:RimJ/RimL family protein N-acetyltransferase
LLAPLIKTERLLLRPYRLEDFPHLLALYETDRAAFIGGRLTRRQVWDGFMNCVGQWAILGIGGWAVEEASSRELVGEVAVHQPADYPETELGWLLFEGFEGRGYAFEAADAARRWAFSDACRLRSLVSYIDRDNSRSIRVAERLGAVLDPGAPTSNNDPCHVFRHRTD